MGKPQLILARRLISTQRREQLSADLSFEHTSSGGVYREYAGAKAGRIRPRGRYGPLKARDAE